MSASPRGLSAWFAALFLASGLIGAVRAQDPGDIPPAPPQPPGQEIQTRGPVHESFAQPVVYDPKPGAVIPRRPPDPIEELPPDQKPEGANVQWIPGYWAWDDARRDYLWISGVWRNIPPGRQWNPGYWHQVDGGVQWVSGTWTPTRGRAAPVPPGLPPGDASSPGRTRRNARRPRRGLGPGCWMWMDTRLRLACPGSGSRREKPNWIWVPAQYVWTPGGYLFCEGYWDRPLATRGVMFAPVYFSQPVYAQPAFVYQPAITIGVGGLMASLFVRPSFGVYYFGDYYATSYVNIGIYPWFSFHQSRYGYDPMFAYYSVTYARTNPNWVVQQREAFLFRREHIDARPMHTYAEMARVADARRSFATSQLAPDGRGAPRGGFAPGRGGGAAADRGPSRAGPAVPAGAGQPRGRPGEARRRRAEPGEGGRGRPLADRRRAPRRGRRSRPPRPSGRAGSPGPRPRGPPARPRPPRRPARAAPGCGPRGAEAALTVTRVAWPRLRWAMSEGRIEDMAAKPRP